MSEVQDSDFATSWWGHEWIDSLHRLSTAWQNRLPRGRDYAAKGHVISLSVSSGKIVASVQGSRSRPYKTEVEVPTFDAEKWDELIGVLAGEARYPAMLLAGQMPDGIQDIFQKINLNLFPTRNSELFAQCNCPDKARPCKHIAAVHYAFGKALDRDPFLLFLLRGIDREALLQRFHRFWFGDEIAEEVEENWSLTGGDQEGLPILPLSADRFNRSADHELDISVYVQRAEQPLFILKRLGNPDSWDLPINIDDLLGPVIEEAGKLAFDFANDQGMGETDTETRTDDISEEDRQSPYDNLFKAFEMPAVVEAAAKSEEEIRSTLPGALPSADILASAIGVNLGAAEANRAKELKTKKDQPGAVLIRKGRDGAPTVRKRRKVVADDPAEATTVTRRAAASTPESDAPKAPGVATRKRRKVAGDSGPTVVRRRKRVVAGGSGGDEAKEHRKKLVKLDASVLEALSAGDREAAFARALEAWKLEPNEKRFLLVAANSDEVEDADEQLSAEADRLVGNARRGARRIDVPRLLMLLLAGRYRESADVVGGMEDEVWKGTDPVGVVFLPFALMALVAERTVADESNLSQLWNKLFDRGEGLFPDLDDEPAPVGAWLEWSLEDYPLDEEFEEHLREVIKNVAMSLVESAREEALALTPMQVASHVAAVGETLRLIADEQECDQFIAIASARSAAAPALGRALQQALASSSILSYRS